MRIFPSPKNRIMWGPGVFIIYSRSFARIKIIQQNDFNNFFQWKLSEIVASWNWNEDIVSCKVFWIRYIIAYQKIEIDHLID